MTRRTLLSAGPALLASPVRFGPAADQGLPPLPQPGQPMEQVLRALIAWHGGTEAAVVALTQSLDQGLGDYVDDEQYNAIKPHLERLEDWAGARTIDDATYEDRVQAACANYGYVR
jgi:hypothetical protein